MTITTEQAVALAEKPAGYISRTGHGTYFKETITPDLAELEHGGNKMWVALFTRQQVIKQLALVSGMMPKLWQGDNETLYCDGDEVQEAIAVLQARIEKLERLLLRYRNETPLGHQPHMIAHEVDEAMNKESGK